MKSSVVLALVVACFEAVRTECPDVVTEDTVGERTRRADLVFRGRPLQHDDTVTTVVTLWVEEVYKGAGPLSAALGDAPDALDVNDKLVNVSGWGLCPPETQQSVVVFARWESPNSDVIRATDPSSPWSKTTETTVWAAVGWEPWSEWSACSVSCGDGFEERHRRCSGNPSLRSKRINCASDGYSAQRRRCNLFSCEGAVTPLSVATRGVGRNVATGGGGRRAGGGEYLWVPSTQLFPGGHLPKDLAILCTLRMHPVSEENGSASRVGAVLSFGARRRHQPFLSVEIDSRTLRLVHSPGGDDGDPVTVLNSLEVPTSLGDGHWHRIALGLQENAVHSYVDCEWMRTDVLRRGALKIPLDADIVVGYLFQGEISELILVTSPEAAAQHCESSAEPFRWASPRTPAQHGRRPEHAQKVPPQEDEKNIYGREEIWDTVKEKKDKMNEQRGDVGDEEDSSEDMTRTCACMNGSVIVERTGKRCEHALCAGGGSCLHGGRSVKARCVCTGGWTGTRCEKPACGQPCRFGGRCVAPHICACPPLARGPFCQTFTCEPSCMNGGSCVGPGQCECPHNATGDACEKPVCDPPCAAGGVCVRGNRCVCAPGAKGPRCEMTRKRRLLRAWSTVNNVDSEDLRLLKLPSPNVDVDDGGGAG